MSVIATNGLVKIYGKGGNEFHALKGIDFEVMSKEFVSIMGPSGSGKTTLLNMLSGLDKSDGGDIFIGDKSINSISDEEISILRRNDIGFIYQDFNLLNSLTIKENIALPLIIDKKKAKLIDNKVDEIMKYLGIFDIKDSYPTQTSGGQKQRAAIGRALVHNPLILMADEPTGNLDTKATNDTMTLFEQLNKERGVTILMVTHEPAAASYSNTVVLLKDGRLDATIYKDGRTRKEFHDKILNHLSNLEDSVYEF